MRYNVLVRRSYSIPGRLAPSRVEEWIVVDPKDTQASPNPAAAMAMAKQQAEEEHGGVASVHNCVPLPVEATEIYDAENYAPQTHSSIGPAELGGKLPPITSATPVLKRKPGRPPKRPIADDETPVDAKADAAAREAIERMGLVVPQTEG